MSLSKSLCEFEQGDLPALISMQSHVSHGYVGNAVATFALRRLGCEVTPLHTVMYSSHLGYKGWRGEAIAPARLGALIDGLEQIGALAIQRALLLGFLGSPEHGRLARSLRDRMSLDALLIVDPVMGDHGSLYVPGSLVDFYLEALPGGVDVLVPNVFELGVLTRRPIEGLEQAREALAMLEIEHHTANPEIAPLFVVKGVPDPADPEHLYVLARRAGDERIWRTERFARSFAGAGDLFSATLTAALLFGVSAARAVEHAMAMTSAVLARTYEMNERKELAIIAAQHVLCLDDLSATPLVEEVSP